MISFDDNGICCRQANVYIDPWRPVENAIVTHAHSDHARWGMKRYLAHHHAVPVMRYRLGSDIAIQGLAYQETLQISGVTISLHPAGHIWGSAQVRLEYKGEVWVISGDYKLLRDDVTEPFEPVKCHSFVTESTFGLPVYKFPEKESVQQEINGWWRQNAAEGSNSVLIVYALGKAQSVLQLLDPNIGKIYTHGAVDNINRLFEQTLYPLHPTERIEATTDRKQMNRAMIIAPPSAIGTPWMRKLQPYKLGICSGWMQLRGARRRRGADRGFVLSDHCDFQQLNTAVKATGAANVYVTHGYKSIYAKWLREQYGLNASEVDTLYTDAGEPGEEIIAKEVGDEGIQ